MSESSTTPSDSARCDTPRRRTLLVEQVSEAAVVTSRLGEIIDWNAAAERMFGWTSAEVLGRRWEFLLSSADSAEREEGSATAPRSGRWSFARKDGSAGICEIVAVPLLDGGTLSLLLEVSERLESPGDFTGAMTHDLNNLLTGVLGNASLVRMDLPEDHPVQEFLEQIELAATRAAELCRGWLKGKS